MKREDDEKLWDLLGHAAEPKISPFFARNVLREIRESRGRSRVTGWLKWLAPATAVAVMVIAALFLRVQMPDRNHLDSAADQLALMDAQDSEVMTDLDDLFASDDSTSWDDAVLL
ncbi:MAG: hypothetical protein QOF24_1239 [Verrucomicrobiota bacterium]|jgi:hypothetical protein